MKKIISIVCAMSLALGMSTGCSKKAATGADGEKINIRFSFWEPSTGKEMETALEGIAESYEADHPNVNIELVSQAVTGYQDWIKTQMAVDDLPEIELNYATYLINQYDAGAVINLKEELNSPNPYNEDKIWIDTFVEGSMDGGHEYRRQPEFNIPLFRTGIAMFYNKTMYEELGLEIPKNWNEFLANCDVIDKAGKTPIAFMGQKADAVNWLRWELVGGLCVERWLADKGFNFNGDHYISMNEMVKAIDTGSLNMATNKEYQEDFKKFVEYVKQYLKYSPNASGLDESAAKTIFLSGNAAHLNSGSWDIVGLLKNDEINFEMGVFPYPHLTKENSEYAGKGISNNCIQTIAITSSVNKQEGAKEAAVDFVMYLTSPEQYSKFANATYQIPSVKDVDTDPVFDAFMEDGYPLANLFHTGESAAGKTMKDIVTSIIAGTDVELNDAAFAEIQRTLEAYAEKKKETEKISAENNYGLDSMPMVNGEFFPEK